MLQSAFRERLGHSTLGAEFGISVERGRSLAGLPVGTKVFVMNEAPELRADPTADSVGIVLGQTDARVQMITLSPKAGSRWSVHNAYGERVSEIPDAVAALDRLFSPIGEFGSIAVLSEATGKLLGTGTAPTIGQAGCNSHERSNLPLTLRMSQLLDNYRWKPAALHIDSQLLRRNQEGEIIHLLPGQSYTGQPSKDMRDQRSMLDRIHLLTADRRSALYGKTGAAVLRGIETAIGRGDFTDRQRPVVDVAAVIERGASKIVI